MFCSHSDGPPPLLIKRNLAKRYQVSSSRTRICPVLGRCHKANLNQPQITLPQRVNIGWIRASLCKTNPIPGRRGRIQSRVPGDQRQTTEFTDTHRKENSDQPCLSVSFPGATPARRADLWPQLFSDVNCIALWISSEKILTRLYSVLHWFHKRLEVNIKNSRENLCFQTVIVFSFGSFDNSNKCTVLWKMTARLITVSTSVNNEMWVKLSP